MKKIKSLCSLVLIMTLSFVFLTGCEGKKTPVTKDSVKSKPTFQEIVNAFINTDISYYVDSLKEHLGDLKNVSVNDVQEFIDQISVVYGDGSIALPNSDTVYTSIVDLGKLTSYSSTTRGVNDAIIIVKGATLHTAEGNSEKINIVALQGTDFNEGQATGIKEDLLVGMECSNYYLYDAFLAITDNIDEGSTLYIAGLSLGGMVAQQVAGIEYLQKHYNVKYVSAIGSPLIAPEMINYKETSVSRFVIENDVVPTLSNSAEDIYWNSKQNLVVDGQGVYKSFVGAHVFGYVNADIWGKYDVLGVEGGKAKITFENVESVTLHPAPNKTANSK